MTAPLVDLAIRYSPCSPSDTVAAGFVEARRFEVRSERLSAA